MRALTNRTGDPEKGPKDQDPLEVLAKMFRQFLEYGFERPPMSDAMREFNEKADRMPTASQPPSMRPDRRDAAPMQKMTPKGINAKNFSDPLKRGLYEKLDVEATRNRRTVGEGVKPRRRLRKRR